MSVLIDIEQPSSRDTLSAGSGGKALLPCDMIAAPHGDQRFDLCRRALLDVGLTEVTTVSEYPFGASQLYRQRLNLLDHRHQLLFVVQIDLPQQHRRVIRRRARSPVGFDQFRQSQSVDRFHHKARQVTLRQPLIHRWSQRKSSVAVDQSKVVHDFHYREGTAQ